MYIIFFRKGIVMKKTISIFMALIMIFSVLSVGASALNAPVEIKFAPTSDRRAT